MNERDSEQVKLDLQKRGHVPVEREEDADVILLNTCSVRDMAESKALGKMGALKKLRRKKPKLILGFMGCMAQRLGEKLDKKSPGVDLIVGTQKFHCVAQYVEEAFLRREQVLMDQDRYELENEFKQITEFKAFVNIDEEINSQNRIKDHAPPIKTKEASAFISIMQGCNMNCTFCIVPTTRGKERSRSIESIVDEAKNLVAGGTREIILLGQIVNLYGRKEFQKINGKSPFVQLLEALNNINGLERIRFTSPHPIGFRSDLIASFSYLDKLMEHVHLPLQSGSNRILKAMKRPYTADSYMELISALRATKNNIAITTDIIVGFPGETEEDYLKTRHLAETINFDTAFIFRYSSRKDTPASLMADQVSEKIKELRNQDLLSVINTSATQHLQSYIGTEQEVLCEGYSKKDSTRLMGRTRTNKIVVFNGPAEKLQGELLPIKIVESSHSTLYGNVI